MKTARHEGLECCHGPHRDVVTYILWSLRLRRYELPLYEYRCLKCDRHTDKIENLNGPHLKKCPHCGGKGKYVVYPPPNQFKETSWEATDPGPETPGADTPK